MLVPTATADMADSLFTAHTRSHASRTDIVPSLLATAQTHLVIARITRHKLISAASNYMPESYNTAADLDGSGHSGQPEPGATDHRAACP